jgi:cell wall assembly regulator SMI1
MLVYDIDHVTAAELQGISDRLEGLEALMSSTHSHQHGGPDDCCVRLVFPLSRSLTPNEFRHVHRVVRQRYQLEWRRPGQTTLSGVDQSTKDLSRLYFLPTAPKGSEVIEAHESGALLDLDAILRDRTPEPLPLRPPRPSAPSSDATDMESLRKLLRKYDPKWKDESNEVITRKELARRAEVGEPLTKPDELGQRDISCLRLGKILAHCLPPAVSAAAVSEMIYASITSMPVLETDGAEDTVEARFTKVESSRQAGIKAQATRDAAAVAKKEHGVQVAGEMKKRFKLKAGPSAREPAAAEAEEDPEEAAKIAAALEDWDSLILRERTEDGSDGKMKNATVNLNTILSYSPEWLDVLRYNQVTKDVELTPDNPLLPHESTPTQITTGVNYWAQTKHNLFFKHHEVQAAIVHVAKMNAFDPLQDYLNSVKGDLVSRIDTFLETYCGAVLTDASGVDISAHVRRISRRWFIGAVARGLDPGCKNDTVLILEGDQGIRKSMMLDVLGGEWFADSAINISDKDSKMLAGRSWIVEMPELSALHSSATEHQKAFFSSRVDKFRPPYGSVIEVFKRRCVFVGSTNDERYMNDITGNRRYWAVWCLKFLIRNARRDRDLLWAEAVRLYKEGFTCPVCLEHEERCVDHRWWFDEAENKVLEMVNNQRLKNEFADAITDYILKIDTLSRPTHLTMFDIATKILGLTADRVNGQQGPIGRALKTLGFTRERSKIKGALQSWQHKVPDELLKAPLRKPFRPAAAMAQA